MITLKNICLLITFAIASNFWPSVRGKVIIKLPKKIMSSGGGATGGILQLLAAGFVVKLLQDFKIPDLSSLTSKFKGGGDGMTVVTPIQVPSSGMMGWPSGGMANMGWPCGGMANMGWPMMGMDAGLNTGMMGNGWNAGGMMMMNNGWNNAGNMGTGNFKGRPMMGNMNMKD